MMRSLGLVAVVLLIGGTSTTYAQVECPPSVNVEQKGAAPKEWSVDYSKMAAELSSVTIFDGPPEEMASLKYDDERSAKGEIIQTWELPANQRGYWIECGYVNTTAQLRRKLPDDIRSCEVVLERSMSFGGGGAVVKRATCSASPQPRTAH